MPIASHRQSGILFLVNIVMPWICAEERNESTELMR
jgi:hypothetical protein